ncbi:LysR family transcriptional regulator [Bisbaumannia pacifica]|uniref:LysR family transcriptional regulator n=1 Tax=Bisbaumannia pacifica TaxID=77098 RepID=A0ABD4L6T1_9GAMM|nr:LysR family transcriptional regulator [Halomonas pacifica]MBH8581463.1 LysR family transcriptional regulator [Halomonas pacifica]
MHLLLPGLRYFEEVARQGSLRRAAERLHVAASAVNRQILKLEDELGVPLFERLPRGLRLSPAGELLLEQVRQWQRDERGLQEELGEIRGSGCAEVRIASVESLTDQLLPEVLAEFRRDFPRVRFVVMTGMTDAILERVATGEADIGLCINPPTLPRIRLIEQVELEFGAVMEPDHPLAAEASVSLEACLAYPTILPDSEMFHGSTLQQVLARADLEATPYVACNRILGIKSMVRAGLGVAFLNRLDIARERIHGELLFRPLRERGIARARLSLCAHSDRDLPLAIRALVERLGAAMRGIDP